jgi:hypothetical protein
MSGLYQLNAVVGRVMLARAPAVRGVSHHAASQVRANPASRKPSSALHVACQLSFEYFQRRQAPGWQDA